MKGSVLLAAAAGGTLLYHATGSSGSSGSSSTSAGPSGSGGDLPDPVTGDAYGNPVVLGISTQQFERMDSDNSGSIEPDELDRSVV